MKNLLKSFISICLTTFLTISSSAQNSLILQPGPSDGQDSYVFERDMTKNFNTSSEFISFAWTFSGTPFLGKSYIKFDLSQIPPNAEILSAKLSLYHNTTSSSAGQAGENKSTLKKVTSPWDANTVNWTNQPSTTNTQAVTLATSQSNSQDYENIDISSFVKDWHQSPSTNHGFELDIVNKTPLASMKFCSSNCSNASKRPKLIIMYSSGRIDQTPSAEVYPNPTDNFIIIDLTNLEQNRIFRLYNSLGQLIIATPLSENSTFVSTHDLSSGIYFYHIETETFSKIGKIIKTR